MTSLRNALANLRQAIGDRSAEPPYLIITREAIQFNPNSEYWLDLEEFSEGLVALRGGMSTQLDPATIDALHTAISLVCGRFREGFIIPDSQPFEEWALLKREQFDRAAMQALRGLADYFEAKGDYNQALSYSWRQVELERWQEEGHQQLMRLLALSGRRSEALAQYDICTQMLKKDLGVEPSSLTTALYEAIRDGRLAHGTPQPLEDLPFPGEPPYKGMQFFSEADAGLFFGRERLVARVVGHLRTLLAAKEEPKIRFLAVVGASGSGKSSILRAGLAVAIKTGKELVDGTHPPEGSPNWQVHILTPTAHPLEALARSLAPPSYSQVAIANLIDNMGREACSLHLFASRQMQAGKAGGYLLLVVDQFEELFTLCCEASEREAFINNLLNAAESPGPVIVIIALRADFYAHCSRYQQLRQVVSARQEYIGPMNSEELRQVIEQPAQIAGWDFEAGLVDLILKEAGEEPGVLPLLSHALLETWRRRRGRTMTLKGYSETGGVGRAIAQTAESVFNSLLPEQKIIARRIFLRLTGFGEGTQETRRRATLRELVRQPDEWTDLEIVLGILSEVRLITLAEGVVEVAHEALIHEWPALRQWLDEDREGLRIQRHLSETALAWEKIRRDPGELYRGARLAQALEWVSMQDHAQQLNPLEREFLAASQQLAEQEAAEKEAQYQQQLEAARQLAETQRQKAEQQAQASRRLRRRALYLISALLGVFVLAVVAILLSFHNANLARQNADNASLAQTQQAQAQRASTQAIAEANLRAKQQKIAESESALRATAQVEAEIQRNEADRQAQLAFSRELVAAAGRTLDADPELSNWLALQAFSVSQSAGFPISLELENMLHQAVQASRLHLTLSAHTGGVWSVAYSPDGLILASGSQDQTIKLWDALTGQELRTLYGHLGSVEDIDFSPDGRLLASASVDGTAIVWNLASGEPEAILDIKSGPLWAVAFSPNGKYLATSHADGSVRVWDVPSEQTAAKVLFEMPEQGGLITFSPDGERLATGGLDGAVHVWELIQGQEVLSLPVVSNNLAFSPDGRRLATEAQDRVIIWDASSGEELITLCCHEFLIRGVVFSPDGAFLATGGQEGIAKVWDTGTGEEILRLVGHAGAVDTLAFNPLCVGPPESPFKWCGRYLATGSRDGLVRIWDVSPAGSRELLTSTGMVGGYSSDGSSLYVIDLGISNQAQIHRWQIPIGSEAREIEFYALPPLPAPIVAGGFSQDQSQAAVVSAEGTVQIWDLETGRETLTYTVPISSGWVSGITFIPAGLRLISADGESQITIWDVVTGHSLVSLPLPEAVVKFNRDGAQIATGGADGMIKVWDSYTGEELFILEGHDLPLNDVAFSPDGRLLASGGMDTVIKVWDLEKRELLYTLPGHISSIFTLEFSQDGKLLASGSLDGATKVWDVSRNGWNAGRELHNFSSLMKSINFIFFSPDGKRLGTGSYYDGAVRVYTLDPAELVTIANSRLTRPFTSQECQRYLHMSDCP
jgi:WD40 repeat protein/DNA-binding SARP family transcriptional activator/energy-coupling factor transporter ATP-binding protein EcfA2